MMRLLEAAVGQLHDLKHPALGTLLEAASLLRRQIHPLPEREVPDGKAGWWPGRHARCRTILIVTSRGRYASRIYARSFSVAKRTSRDPSSARLGSHRAHSSFGVAWNWPLGACLRPMRLLSDIALQCGFSDQSHLCKQFRQALDQTPAAWRRVHRLQHEENAKPPLERLARLLRDGAQVSAA
jgi:AraC-like DNA-binding protein